MSDALQVLLNEYNQLRESERSIRGHLHGVNSFAVAVVSGLLVGITVYKIQILALAGPLIFYLVGFLWSSDALRLLRVVEHCRALEREMRRLSSTPSERLLVGFEDARHAGFGVGHFVRYNSTILAAALFYGIFYVLFFYLLWNSEYSTGAKRWCVVAYVLFGGLFWGYDLWTNRRYLLRPKE